MFFDGRDVDAFLAKVSAFATQRSKEFAADGL